jgi:hypothetical protein
MLTKEKDRSEYEASDVKTIGESLNDQEIE